MKKNAEEFFDQIICGDARDVLKTVPDNCIDLIVTSPCYDDLRSYEGKEWNFDVFKDIAREMARTLKQGGVIVWVVNDAYRKGSRTLTSLKHALYFKEECGLSVHDMMVYQKSGFNFPANNRYHQIWEPMFVFSKGKPKTFNPIKDRKNAYPGQVTHSFHRTSDGHKDMSIVKAKPAEEYGMRFNVWRYKTGGGQVTEDKIAHQHPAIFPEQLAADHIISWSNEGDLIADVMCGSGTTLKMAKKLKRHFLGIDISEKYCEIAKNRLEKIEESVKL